MICKKLTLSAVPIAILALCSLPPMSAYTLLTEQTTTISLCGHLFNIDSNAAGLTAQQRAQIVQKNLDNALVAARDRTASAVRVEVVNRNPVVTLDHFMVVTADGNSASRSNMTQMELAQKWANSIRVCLADSDAINKYISMLTGKYPTKKVAFGGMTRDEIAVAPSAMLFPIELVTPISTDTTQLGDRIEAVISKDVPLETSYAGYLPAGTQVFGAVESALPYVPNHYAGRDAFTVNFYEFRTPDGKRIPIDAHIYGSVNNSRMVNIKPLFAQCCGNGTTVKDLSLINVHVKPAKGNIVGSWKGLSIEGPLGETKSMQKLTGEFDGHLRAPGLEYSMPRLVFDRQEDLVLPAGEPMLLQLSATTTIAVAGRSL
jgi:hypothetical protein